MVTVLQISDTHLRAAPHAPAERDPDASLAATLDAVKDVHADLLLLTGDLADDASLAGVVRLHEQVADLAPNVIAVAGNHDELPHVRAVFGSLDTVEVGAWRVLAVETYIPGEDHGCVDVADLVRRLDEVDARHTVVALHHPPRSDSTHPMFQLMHADEMLEALHARPHVRAVVSGHLHQVFDRVEDDLILCGGPSSYFAIVHEGGDYRLVDDGFIGSQVLTLGDDGSFTCERVARSLGC